MGGLGFSDFGGFRVLGGLGFGASGLGQLGLGPGVWAAQGLWLRVWASRGLGFGTPLVYTPCNMSFDIHLDPCISPVATGTLIVGLRVFRRWESLSCSAFEVQGLGLWFAAGVLVGPVKVS